jgi:hypothetical protein
MWVARGCGPLLLLALAAAPAAGQDPTDIYLLDLGPAGEGITVVGSPRAVTDRDGYDNQPAFTADGRAILYTSIRDGQADTYRYDLAADRTVQVTRTAESEYSPTPMPGLDRFSVVRVEQDSTQRLWSFAPDGSDPRLLLPTLAPVGYHAWITPEALALFILGDPPTLQLAELGRAAAWVGAAGIGRSLQRVPDRSAVSYTRNVGDAWRLESLDLVTGEVRHLARLPAPDGYHVWTPDGALLTAEGTEIYQLDDRGEWRPVADVADHGLGTITRLAVSPDGGRLAIVVDRPPASSP